MAATVTVNDVLDGHVVLDMECLDRIYVNGYVPNLQVGGQVVSFLTAHLGNPIPSPAILERIGTAFRRAVDRCSKPPCGGWPRWSRARQALRRCSPWWPRRWPAA